MKKLLKPLALILALTIVCQMLVVGAAAEIKNGNCGSNATYSLDKETGIFTLSGTGATDDYSKFDEEGWSPIWRPGSSSGSSSSKYVPWQKDVDSINTIIIEEGITKIGNNAFSQCYNVQKLVFFSEDVQISSSAFEKSESVYTIYLYQGSTADSYFSDAKYTKIYLDNDDSPSNEEDFEYTINSDGETVTITSYIGEDTEVVIPATIGGYAVSVIGAYSFGWKGVTCVTIPEGVTAVENRAFTDCSELNTVIFKAKDASIASDAFHFCSSLDIIYLYAGSTADSYFSETYTKIYLEENYTVTYDANGGVDAPASQRKTENIDLILSEDVPTREGYSFLGWATSKDGSVVYSAGDIYTENADVTLYAVWEENKITTYKIVYIASGGTGIPASQTKEKDIDLTLSEITPTRNGYSFLGWATSKDGEVEYAPGDTYTENASVILYAVWEENGDTPVEPPVAADFEYEINPDETTVTITKYIGSDEDVAVPSNINGYDVTGIGESAFAECESLNSVTIPDSVTNIGVDAFRGCYSLMSITFKTKNADIGSFAFDACDNLSTIYLYKNSTADEYFSADDYTKIYLDDDVEAVYGDINSDESIDIKDVVLFAQYLAAWDVVVDERNADCNADGKINIKDVVLLAQFLANWEVTLG